MKVDKSKQLQSTTPKPADAKPAQQQRQIKPTKSQPLAPPPDEVDEASQESFPASDPPAWTPSHS